MRWALLAALLAATSNLERRKPYDVCTVFSLARSLSFACALSLARVCVIRCNWSSYHTGTKILSSFHSLGLKRLLGTLTALQTTSSRPLDTWERSSFRETRNCVQWTIWITGFWFWYKMIVMTKKKVIAARNLKDCLPSLPLKTRKAKKKIKVSLSRQLYASLKRALIEP